MKIIFFDGHCSLCNRFIDGLIKIDKKGVLKFASLQGETAKKYLRSSAVESEPMEAPASEFETMVYHRDGEIIQRSTAVLKALEDLGGCWKFVRVFLLIPVFIRDCLYRWMARNRFKIFGRRDTCRIPTSKERDRLLP